MADADALSRTVWDTIKASLIKAGLDLRIWAKIAPGPRTAEEIAREEGWDETGTRMLLDALCAMGLAAKREGRYALTKIARRYLLPGEPTYIGDSLLAEMAWEARGRLADAVRTGERPLMGDGLAPGCAALWAQSDEAACRRADPAEGLDAVDALWRGLRIEPREGLRVLDVACGSGIRTLALARGHRGVRVTLQDWPPVLEVAVEIAERLGVRDQVTTLPGDLREVDFGRERFDVVWLGRITHYFGAEDLVRFLRKVCASLVAGGIAVIAAPVADEERCGDALPLVAAMEMFVRSAEGDVYTFSEYERFLGQAGFAQMERAAPDVIRAVKA